MAVMEEAKDRVLPAKVLEAISLYDYVRFTWADVHGISRSKVVPRRHVERFYHEGVQAYSGKRERMGF